MFLKSPVTRRDWRAFFKKTPWLILLLIVVMLLIRFVITAFFIISEAVGPAGGG